MGTIYDVSAAPSPDSYDVTSVIGCDLSPAVNIEPRALGCFVTRVRVREPDFFGC